MSNIRFLDNVAVTAFSDSQVVGSNFPRVVFAGETRIVSTNTNSYAYEIFNLGVININGGIAVEIGGETVFSHGLLRAENKYVNEGTININGIFEVGDVFSN